MPENGDKTVVVVVVLIITTTTITVLPFWYLLTEVVPDIFQKTSKTVVCVCVCVL